MINFLSFGGGDKKLKQGKDRGCATEGDVKGDGALVPEQRDPEETYDDLGLNK